MDHEAERIDLMKHGAAAMAVTGLVLFVPANLLPFMTFETLGQKSTPTILAGVQALYETGSPFLALVVFLASIVLPLLKILVVLALLTPLGRHVAAESCEKAVFVFDLIGRWAMLDVFLLAILVAVMKFGSAGQTTPGPGAVLFTLVVVATMIAYTLMEKLIAQRGRVRHE